MGNLSGVSQSASVQHVQQKQVLDQNHGHNQLVVDAIDVQTVVKHLVKKCPIDTITVNLNS